MHRDVCSGNSIRFHAKGDTSGQVGAAHARRESVIYAVEIREREREREGLLTVGVES